MRRRLLILLSLLVLLMQPVGLLHGLSHRHGPAPAGSLQLQSAAAQSDDGATSAVELACLECLALAALGSALLPDLPVFTPLRIAFAAPTAPPITLRGGTGAGYHARGPPLFLA